MDNPGLDTFSDDIEARLARFDEESFEDNQNFDECHLFESESKHLNDGFTLESNVSPADFLEQRINFREQGGKHFAYHHSEINYHATSASLSEPVAYKTQRYYLGANINFEKKRCEIKDTNSPRPHRQIRDYHNEDSLHASQLYKTMDLEASHGVHKDKLSLSNDSFEEVDCNVDFRSNKDVNVPRNSEMTHGQNKYLSHHSSYNDFKKNKNVSLNSDFRTDSKKEKSERIKKLENSSNSYVSYSDENDVELKDDVNLQQKHFSGISNFGMLSHQSNNHKVTQVHDIGFRSHNKISDFPDLEMKKRNHYFHSNKKSLRVCNPSIFNDNSEINQIYSEDTENHFYIKHKSDTKMLNYTQTESSPEYPENQPKLENKVNINIDKHEFRTYDDEICTKSENSYVDIRRRSRIRKSTANTLTMHDAQRIAPLILKGVTDDISFENRSKNFTSDHEEHMSRSRRKCWAKQCWSNTKHSHAVNISKDLHARENRNALVNSLKSPQYAAQSKKKTCADCWSSFLKVSSSRFQLWNRTLKKIEGQFGTGVVSYFVFLRWLILLNFVIFILYFLFIILPSSVFPLLPHQNVEAPNTTLLTEEYINQFPKFENVAFSKKRISFDNKSLNLNQDLLSNLGTLLDNYVPNEIIDIATRFDKSNHTGEDRYKISLYCKERYKKEMDNHTTQTFSFLQDFLQGTGWLQSTVLFLGFYPDRDVSYFGLKYNLPIAFLAVLIVSFFLSLGLMLQYSSHGIEENILTQKSNYLTFSNILFCSWDYCIEDKKTADIRHKSISCEIKSNLAEQHRKSEVSRWSSRKRMKVYMLRAAINILVVAALFGCFYLIYKVVNIQLEKQRQNALKDAGAYTLFIQFLPPLVITGLNIIMPIIFSVVVKLEMYSSQTQVNIALFRIVFLRLASVFVLVSTLYQQITCQPKDECRAGMTEFCRTPICWETYVGQQLYKLVVTDFLVYICMFLGYDLPRDFIVQKCKCKVTEVVGRQVFDLPSQVLSLVYSQTLCWLGLFYSPILPGISVLKFLIIFYMKKLVVLKHCAPSPILYKASRTNSIFMTILMLSLFVVTMIHGYCLTSIEPSPGCSPFRQYVVMINAISKPIKAQLPSLFKFMSYLFSGFFFILAFLLLIIIIYYYWTIVVAHRKMTKVLKAQIAVEGRDKQFLLNRLAEAARQITAIS